MLRTVSETGIKFGEKCYLEFSGQSSWFYDGAFTNPVSGRLEQSGKVFTYSTSLTMVWQFNKHFEVPKVKLVVM